jgi:hypothetical protein
MPCFQRTLNLSLGEQLHIVGNSLNKTILLISLLRIIDVQPTWMHIKEKREEVNHKKPVKLRECYPEPIRQAPQRRPQLSLPSWQDGTKRERNL